MSRYSDLLKTRMIFHRHLYPKYRQMSILCRPNDIEKLRPLGQLNDHVTLHLPAAHTSCCHTYSPWADLSNTAVIEFRNDSARNALSGKMMAEFADVLTKLEEEAPSLACVVLRGAGGHFCAGADIRVAKDHLISADSGALMSRVMTSTLNRLRKLPLVSFALIEGAAVGGGAELTTSCDFRIMDKDAVVQFVHAKMGVSPGWGGGARLVKLVGRQRALRLLCRTERMTARSALEHGFADVVALDTCIEAVAFDFIRVFDSTEPVVLQGLKQVITNADDILFDQMLEEEHAIFNSLWGGPANLKALSQVNKKNNKKPS